MSRISRLLRIKSDQTKRLRRFIYIIEILDRVYVITINKYVAHSDISRSALFETLISNLFQASHQYHRE